MKSRTLVAKYCHLIRLKFIEFSGLGAKYILPGGVQQCGPQNKK